MIRALCVLLILACSLPAAAWWSPDWTQRKTIGINTTATGANLQQGVDDVPVLVRLHSGNFPQFLNVRDGGADFRFVAGDDLTPLKYHVEHFDPVAQIAMVWVKVPVVNPQSTGQTFYLYFGNQAAAKGDDSGATFDFDTAAAFHFSGTTPQALDATAYATPITGTFIPNPASIIGPGAILSGTGPLVVADAPQLAMTAEKGWTAELWVRFDALPDTPVVLLERSDAGGSLALTVDGGALQARYGDAEVASFTPLGAATWHHVALVLGNGQMQLYLDGAQVGGTPVTLAPMSGAVYVGGAADGGALASASIDELRISSTARSPDALAFNAAIQGERNDAVMTYGADEAADSAGAAGGEGHASHFGIIINNVFGKKEAIVEQLVIGLCGVMAAIAIVVMFLKAVFLSRSRRATNKFLSAYENLAGIGSNPEQLGSLASEEAKYDDSPLFSVYAQGLKEIRSRISPAVGASPVGLDAKSLNAIRATLDAIMVREGQRLNSQLVLLTIAISGGPFIGLLGTVVGVMVTFAAIAATGDVNIAAIAPGMAAALLATVAGLGVAIPALFGYNYLSAKAKDISADMHVFADEFVARLNEIYGQ